MSQDLGSRTVIAYSTRTLGGSDWEDVIAQNAQRSKSGGPPLLSVTSRPVFVDIGRWYGTEGRKDGDRHSHTKGLFDADLLVILGDGVMEDEMFSVFSSAIDHRDPALDNHEIKVVRLPVNYVQKEASPESRGPFSRAHREADRIAQQEANLASQATLDKVVDVLATLAEDRQDIKDLVGALKEGVISDIHPPVEEIAAKSQPPEEVRNQKTQTRGRKAS